MNLLLLVILVILIIIKIKILKKELRENQKKLWPIYFSSLVAEVTSLIGVCIIQSVVVGASLGAILVFFVICLICVIENFILLIIGIIYFVRQRKNVKDENKKLKNHTSIKIILTFLCIYSGMLFIGYIPKMLTSKTEIYIKEYVIRYMTTKYGNGDFKIINIARKYDGGFGEKEYQSGYYVNIKTSYSNKIIGLFIEGTTEETMKISYDSLIYDYHNVNSAYNFQNYLINQKIKKLEDKFKEHFDVDIDFYCYCEVPDDYGHIPSKDELVELCQINTNHVDIKINDYVENELDYLKRLTKYSMNYFNNEEELNIYYTLNYKKGSIKINDNTITMKLDNETKIYSREEIKNYIN